MTDQVNLDLLWASGGGKTDPGDVKYATGWISEIPTYQNFNFMLNVLDTNILALAEKANWDYNPLITYKPGAKVRTAAAGVVYYCHTEALGQEPIADTSHNYWSTTPIYGVAPSNGTGKRGLEVNSANTRTTTTWDGQDVTLVNNIPLMAFETTSGSEKNWLFGNKAGDMVIIDCGTVTSPDARTFDASNTFKLFHEGNPPTAAEVTGAVPEAPVDGRSYARTDSNWTIVTSTTVQDEPAPAVTGAGQGWYNLADAQLYIDVDDGDSSQWVPASPPVIPIVDAVDTTYDDTLTALGVTNVQDAIVALYNLINP
jgi:hypothetical protein